MKIGKFQIGDDKVFIIAELSANHNGSLEVALKTVRAAKRAGADCIKLQTYLPNTMTLNSSKDDFIIKGTIWEGQNLYKLYEQAFTPWEWHEALFEEAKKNELICFSSPFDQTAVDFLEKLDTPAYKIASFEINDIPLIRYVASKGKPIIISTGIASYEDINLAIATCREEGNNDIVLLKCTSAYPAPIEEANMNLMNQFKKDFNISHVGLSDHTLGTTLPVVATTLGASVIEKHFILNKEIGGPDSSFSLTEEEFSIMVQNVRNAKQSLGKGEYTLTEKQKKGKDFSRSIYVSKDIKKGEVFNKENLKIVRPGFSLHPKYYDQLLGKKSTRNYEHGDRLSEAEIDD